ncbi:hypothetical protein GCM10023149_53220 [Mucilaginibacter gynuensis]|uniref:Helicase-like protein n=1 Tax=Mucilaginibacter gynuensis TaxID=1302236 RepID=A0ABP8HLX9_9SPHI
MDRIKEAADLIVDINKYRRQQIQDYQLIRSACTYFDRIKSEQITQADLRFLKYVSNIIGVPHFYDVLSKFGKELELEEHDLSTISSLISEATLHTSDSSKVHRYQKIILDLFQPSKLNRYFLSASTSFGKTHIVFEIIKKLAYKNVVLIFPTIALLSENLEKIIDDSNFEYFKNNYAIHTLSEVESFGESNLFIFTPERFLSFIDKNEHLIDFDFAFIDEVYKIDNDYLIDDELRENERDVAYRLAVFYTLKPSVNVLLAGPYIDFSDASEKNYNASFDNFLRDNNIELLDFNNYEIVNKSFTEIRGAKTAIADEELNFKFESGNKTDRLVDIVKAIKRIGENTIVYCSARSATESYAKTLIDSNIFYDHDYQSYNDFVTHIKKYFGDDWVVYRALLNGIGIHHGLVPKYIQKEIINLFNNDRLKVLISTTTITEGVNTSAKNLVVLHSKKGDKNLKKFDAKNIAGRAGRFLYHYNGRVLVLQNKFMDAINATPEAIKHKNYDFESPKDEIDIYYTNDTYLKPEHRATIASIAQRQIERAIPEEVFNMYKVISRSDKIAIYDRIAALNASQFLSIRMLIKKLNYEMDIDSDGFQVVIDVLFPVIKNQKLIFLIERKDKNNRYSILTHFVHFYLDGGFIGSMNFKLKTKGKTKDEAIKETAEFVYNTLKYQVVKYLGVFNIMYKLYQSKQQQVEMDQITGIDRLLTKLEYNALSENGRIASDYGVPSNVVEYYENLEQGSQIRASFDNYENSIFDKIEKIVKKDNR